MEEQATFSKVGESRMVDEVSVQLGNAEATGSICHQGGKVIGVTDGKIKMSGSVIGSFVMGGMTAGAGSALTVSLYAHTPEMSMQQRSAALRVVAALVENVESHLNAE